MKALVLLGNRMKDDGTLSEIMLSRLELTLSAYELFKPSKIIVSGGIANKRAGIPEAEKMHEWLVSKGIPSETIIKEDKSLTTVSNAKFSVEIAEKIGVKELILVTSTYHVARSFHNAALLFKKRMKKYSNIRLFLYCGE